MQAVLQGLTEDGVQDQGGQQLAGSLATAQLGGGDICQINTQRSNMDDYTYLFTGPKLSGFHSKQTLRVVDYNDSSLSS